MMGLAAMRLVMVPLAWLVSAWVVLVRPRASVRETAAVPEMAVAPLVRASRMTLDLVVRVEVAAAGSVWESGP